MAKERLLKVKVIVYMETTEDTIDQTFIGYNSLKEATSFFNKKMNKLEPKPVRVPISYRIVHSISGFLANRKEKSLSY